MLKAANEAFERLTDGEKLLHARFVLKHIEHESILNGCGSDYHKDLKSKKSETKTKL